MLDITKKKKSLRVAIVEGKVRIRADVMTLVKNKGIPKGDVLESARIAGIMAAKKTSSIIPFCHPIPVDHVSLIFFIGRDNIKIQTTVKGEAKTGMEMEAFTATAAALLTVYDMCKAFDRAAVITDIRLVKKSGGKSGTYIRKIRNPKSKIRNKSK